MSGYDMFDEMTQNIKEETVRMLLHIKVEQKVEREQVANISVLPLWASLIKNLCISSFVIDSILPPFPHSLYHLSYTMKRSLVQHPVRLIPLFLPSASRPRFF